MERDLTGRCGTCAFFGRYYVEGAEVQSGDCRIWKARKLETGMCPSYKALGASWDGWTKKKPAAAGTPRRMREEDEPPPKRPLPQEIDLDMDQAEFRRVLTEVLREELGVGDATLSDRWRGGEVVLVPGKKETQEKRVPIDALFNKIVMIRDKLRVLEQKVNGSASLAADEKLQLQQYVTACYGSLTTFNVLFRDDDDRFRGQGGKD